MDVGFIGLGTMGLPMCKRLLSAGIRVRVFDINSNAMQTAIDHGAIACESPADCASHVDVLLTSLPRPEHVQTVMVEQNALSRL